MPAICTGVGRHEGNPERGAQGDSPLRGDGSSGKWNRNPGLATFPGLRRTQLLPRGSLSHTHRGLGRSGQAGLLSHGNKLLSTSRDCWSSRCLVHTRSSCVLGHLSPFTLAPRWQLRDSHRTSSAASRVGPDTLIAVYGGLWEVEGSLCKAGDCLALGCTPETNARSGGKDKNRSLATTS